MFLVNLFHRFKYVLVVIASVLSTLIIIYIVNQSLPELVGTYQATNQASSPYVLLLSFFDKDGRYELYVNSELMEEGSYRQQADNVYVLTEEDHGNTHLVTLLPDNSFH